MTEQSEAPTGVFDGIRVLDFTTGAAGPMVTMLLADHGADVIKIEPPGGDWARSLPGFFQWNRQKRSAVLDLREPADLDVARALAARADIVVESGRPGALERLGVDDATVRATNAGVVWCTITGFGPAEGLDHLAAYEGVVAAEAGRMTGLDQLSGGQPGRMYDRPAFTAAPVASFGAAQLALQGTVAALLERERTGVGQRVETSLVQGAVAFVMRQELARDGRHAAASISAATNRGIELCFLTAECADGRYIQMCARQDHHFRNWLEALGLDDALTDPRYAGGPMRIPTVEDVEALETRLRQRMRTRTQVQWMRIFTDDHDVGADPFLTPTEFLAHADMIDNGRVVELDQPSVGRVRQLGPLVAMTTTPAHITRPAPALGEHTDEVVAEATAQQLSTARAAGVSAGRAHPLEGITILEVAYYIAGPLATTILAEMGARVIKVEPLEGDPYRRTGLQSAKFLHGKESITLDLKSQDGQRILQALIERADAVVHSFRSGAAAKLGLDAATVLARNPRAVHLYAASYGSRGPQAQRAAFHSTPNALAGGGIKQAGRGNPPVNDSYADPGSALGAATALMFGLYARERTGVGQAIETTMLCSTGYIHSADMVQYDGAPPWPIADEGQHGLSPRYRLYQAEDGWLFLAAPRRHEWAAVCAALGQPEQTDDPDADALAASFRTNGVDAWVERLAPTGVGITAVNRQTFDDWLLNEGLLTAADHPTYGSYWRLPPKVSFSGSKPRLAPACAAGEHSRAILAELGYDDDAIARLVAAGVTSDGGT